MVIFGRLCLMQFSIVLVLKVKPNKSGCACGETSCFLTVMYHMMQEMGATITENTQIFVYPFQVLHFECDVDNAEQ